MTSYDFAIQMTAGALALYPLTCRALAALVALRGRDELIFDTYETTPSELLELRAAGFHFC